MHLPSTPQARLSTLLALALLALGPACEDDVVVEQPKKEKVNEVPGGSPPPSKRGAAPPPAAGPAAAPAAGTPVVGSKGAVSLEGLTKDNFNTTEDAEVPPPDPESVRGWIRFQNFELAGTIAASTLGLPAPEQALAEFAETTYGLDDFGGFQTEQPGGLFWVDGFDDPVIVLSVDDPQEILSRVPKGVENRQGNAHSISISVTRQAYVNFPEGFAVISADWQQYPLAGEKIAELMTAPLPEGPDGLPSVLAGEFDKAVWQRYERFVERAAKPPGRAGLEWKATRTDLAVLLATAGTTTIKLGSNGSRHRLLVDVEPSAQAGGIATWLGAERTDANELVARLPETSIAAPVRTVLFQDLSHAPTETPVVPLLASSPFGSLEDEAVTAAELARSATLGASIRVEGGFLEAERTTSLVVIRDRTAFDTAHPGVADALDALDAVELLEPVPVLADARPFSWAPSETSVLNGVEIARTDADELIAVTLRSDDLSLDPSQSGAAVPEMLAEALALGGEAAVPLLAWAHDYATTDAELGPPVMVGLFGVSGTLRLVVEIPQAQLLRLK